MSGWPRGCSAIETPVEGGAAQELSIQPVVEPANPETLPPEPDEPESGPDGAPAAAAQPSVTPEVAKHALSGFHALLWYAIEDGQVVALDDAAFQKGVDWLVATAGKSPVFARYVEYAALVGVQEGAIGLVVAEKDLHEKHLPRLTDVHDQVVTDEQGRERRRVGGALGWLQKHARVGRRAGVGAADRGA